MNKSTAMNEMLNIVRWLDAQKSTAEGQPDGILDEILLKDLADKLVEFVSQVQAQILKK
jgi:hypothetical protein